MKKIITCCDGTWNKPGQEDDGVVTQTNVQKIAHLLCSSDEHGITQLTHYQPGVGTSGTLWNKITGGVSGAGLDSDIIEAYRSVVLNYEEGDLNYLFGFSRGAYTARSLCGLIVNCGILKKENIDQLQNAFDLYRDRDDSTHPNGEIAMAFKAQYSHPPAVHCIGVWDTVGALGIPLSIFAELNDEKYKFHDVQLSSIVKYAFHALAIDEHRKVFNATLWQLSDNSKASTTPPVLEQVWFPGAHCNVGGGYVDAGLSDCALDWMIKKANLAGLSFNGYPPNSFAPDAVNGVIINSNTPLWSWMNDFQPFYRTINLADPDFIGQSLSDCAKDRYENNVAYRPANWPS